MRALFNGLLIACLYSASALAQEAPTNLGPIPIPVLEKEFNHCVKEYKNMGLKLAGQHCQCLMANFYQNMSYKGFMKYQQGLRLMDNDALAYEKNATGECLASTARILGGR